MPGFPGSITPFPDPRIKKCAHLRCGIRHDACHSPGLLFAVNDRRKGQDGQTIEEVTFVDVSLWGRTAEVAGEYLSKGSPIFIEGRLKLDTWETDGQKRSKLRVVGERMQLLGGRRQADESEHSRPTSTNAPEPDPIEEDVPF